MRDLDDARNDAARDALRGLGLDEVVTYGFVGPHHGAPVRSTAICRTCASPIRCARSSR